MRLDSKIPSIVIFINCFNIAGLVLGIFLIVTFFISVFAVLQKNHVTIGLVILNWTLIADSVVVLVVGTIIWFYSLHQRNNYFEVFKASSPQTRIEIQDKVRGYARRRISLPPWPVGY